MSKDYPTIEEAEKILHEGAEYKEQMFNCDSTPYISHPRGVADAAMKIASKTAYLNPEKAYVFGLLHDYGHRIIEKKVNRFHGQEGYDEMMKMNFPAVAKICLTHTFPDKNFNPSDMGYPVDWMLWAQEKLKDIEYDDYDRLIQLCDKFYEEGTKTSIEERVKGISSRYKLSKHQKERLLQEGLDLKLYFDKLCNKNVYEILGVNV